MSFLARLLGRDKAPPAAPKPNAMAEFDRKARALNLPEDVYGRHGSRLETPRSVPWQMMTTGTQPREMVSTTTYLEKYK